LLGSAPRLILRALSRRDGFLGGAPEARPGRGEALRGLPERAEPERVLGRGPGTLGLLVEAPRPSRTVRGRSRIARGRGALPRLQRTTTRHLAQRGSGGLIQRRRSGSVALRGLGQPTAARPPPRPP